jgi:hypothetical protein
MYEIILGLFLIFILISITIISKYIFILTYYQIKELWISTILFIILFGYLRSYILEFNSIIKYIIIPSFMYVIWYILTKYTANLINRNESNIVKTI